jgi:hypothetical protein
VPELSFKKLSCSLPPLLLLPSKIHRQRVMFGHNLVLGIACPALRLSNTRRGLCC